MSQKIVAELLKELHRKDGEVFNIHPGDTVQEAAQHMAEANVGALVVTEFTTEMPMVGIISERDITTRVVAPGKDPKQTLVSEVMTKDVETVTPLTNLEECEEEMKEHRLRHLPVLKDGRVIAMISIRDLLVSTREELEHLVNHLESYIHPFLSR